MKNKTEVKVTISGRVQGVFYRASTRDKADELGVTGYVKNLANGDVEAVFRADPETVEQMIQWCYKGSPASAVQSVITQKSEPPEAFHSFEIRY